MPKTNNGDILCLTVGDLEAIERIVHKVADDLAVNFDRAMERLEERIDGAESRIYSRLSDLEDRLEQMRAYGAAD